MAYITQDMKKEIVAEVKKVLPKSWKVSFRIRHYSTLIMTIKSAPIDLSNGKGNITVNVSRNDYDENTNKVLRDVWAAMNKGNYDNSDIQSDYFDVGYYAYIHAGSWDKAFQVSQR